MRLEINSVVIGGNLTKDVILRTTVANRKVASFVVASNRTYISSSNERLQEAVFVEIEAWGAVAESCKKHLQKGSPVVIVGRLRLDQWQSEHSEKRSKLKVVAMNVQFLPEMDKNVNGHHINR